MSSYENILKETIAKGVKEAFDSFTDEQINDLVISGWLDLQDKYLAMNT